MSWKVHQVTICGEGATVTLRSGKHEVSLWTDEFGIGGRNARTAALAKFLAASGFGGKIELFRYLKDLHDTDPFSLIFQEKGKPRAAI